MTSLRSRLLALLAWPVESQHHARRNAMVAATEMARRRQERTEVEEYLAERGPRQPRRDVI